MAGKPRTKVSTSRETKKKRLSQTRREENMGGVRGDSGLKELPSPRKTGARKTRSRD